MQALERRTQPESASLVCNPGSRAESETVRCVASREPLTGGRLRRIAASPLLALSLNLISAQRLLLGQRERV